MSEAVYHHDRLGRRNWDEGSQAEDERQGQEPKELSLNERWGPVTVLIEKKDVLLANSSARRASLTPSLTASTTNSSGAPGEGGGATSSVSLSGSNPNHEWEAWNSRSSTSTITPSTMTMNTTNPSAAVAAMSGNSNRRQRTSTTMHASLHVPHSLVASLSSLTIVQIQPQLFPLPTARPLLLLIQLADYVPQELSTTTSSICFPPNVTPSPKSIQRALLPLHTVLAQLDAMTRVSKGKENARKEVALMVYSDNAHLPPEISETAFNDGAHGLLTPPFTRASVEHAIHMALEAHARASSMMDRGHYLDDTNFLSTQTRSDDDPPYQTPRPSFYTPFQPSPLSFSAPQDPQKSNRYTRREYAPDERDGVDPLDVTKPFEDMSGHGHQVAGGDVAKVTSKSRDTRPSFPVMEPRKERRASVDLGGLALTSASSSSLNPSFSRSFPVPSSPPSSAMSQDFESSDNPPRISEAHVNENGWRTRAGSGWAGWDSAFVNEEKEGSGTIKSPGKGNQVGKARVRRRSVPPFDEGGELEVAQLVMSMYLHSTSALANASSPLFSNRHQQTLSQSTQASTSSAFSNHSLHHQPSSSNLNALSPTSAASQLSLTLAPHSFNTNEPHHIPPNSSGHPAPSTPPAILPPSPRHSARLLAQLSSWNFEPYILNSVDAANCVILLFSIMLEAFGTPADQSSSSSLFPSSPTDEGRVPLSSITSLSVQKQIAPFIHDLQKMYRKENRYHSFVHALDVLQAVWMFLQGEGRVPPLNPVGTGNREVNASAGGISIRTGEDWAVKLMVDGEEQGSEEGDTRRRRPNWRTRANEKTKLGERMNNGKTRKVPGALGLLNDAEVFLLCLAAIGHDVGHPGNGNAFLKNAHAPLSRLYDDKSALERMHCTLLLRLLKKHGMGHLVSPLTPQGREGRWLVIGTILATDMSWHFEWLEKFGRAMKERRLRLRYLLQMQQTSRSANSTGNRDAATAGDDGESENETQMDEPDLVLNPKGDGTWVVKPESPDNQRRRISLPARMTVGLADGEDDEEAGSGEGLFRSPEVADREDRLFLCQAIMKCGDISNPCRPHNISRHWSTVLLEEWAAQALLERQLGLPVSVVSDANEKVQCVGQVSFIKLFTQPLFDTVSSVLDGLYPIAQACTENRVLWEQKLASFDLPSSGPPQSDLTSASPRPKHVQQMIRPIPLALPIVPTISRYARTIFPLSLPKKKRAPRESRLLASMSPWQVSAVPMSSGNKAAGGGNTTGTGTSVSGSGTSRVWSRSRPESVSSSSTLSSVPGSAGGNNGGERGSTTNLPKTPTLSSSGYGKSPISPVVSPFSASGPGFFNSASTAGAPGAVGAPRDHHHQRNAGFNSIWDVDPDVQEECWMDLLRSWEKRDGRKQNQGGVGLSVGDPTTSIATADSIVTGREVITLRTRTVSLGQGPY